MKELRFRRMDEWNFCIEERNVVQKEDSKNFGEEYWVPTRYFSKVEECLKAALRLGIDGTGIEEFMKSLQESEKNVVRALERSIAEGLIQLSDTKAKGVLQAVGEKV